METCIITDLTPEVEKELYDIFISKLDESYSLVYTDYRDTLGGYPKEIQECIDSNNDCHLYDTVLSMYDEAIHDNSIEEFEELVKQIEKDVKYEKYWEVLPNFNNSDSFWGVIYAIQDRNESEPLKECLGRTEMRCRIELNSNYESLASNWDTGNTYSYDGYFKQMVDLLCLNPANIKKEFLKSGLYVTGRWPNLKSRDGKEVVKYEDLAQEMAHQTSYCRLTFMTMLPLKSLYDNNFETPEYIIIPKGNDCGMYSSWVGGGSLLEMTLQRDLKIPYKKMLGANNYDNMRILVDERGAGNGDCIDEVYGLIRECWGKELMLEYNEK